MREKIIGSLVRPQLLTSRLAREPTTLAHPTKEQLYLFSCWISNRPGRYPAARRYIEWLFVSISHIFLRNGGLRGCWVVKWE